MTNTIGAFLDQMAASRLPQKGPPSPFADFQVHFRDLRNMKLNLGLVPFLVRKTEESTDALNIENTIHELVEYSKQNARSSPVLFVTDATLPAGLSGWPDLR